MLERDYGATMRLGSWECKVKKGSLTEEVYHHYRWLGKNNLIKERHRHRFEFNNKYQKIFEKAGMIICGTTPDGKLVEIEFEVLTDDVSPLTFKMVELYNHDALPLNTKFTNKQFGAWTIAPDYSALLQNYPNPFNPETWIPYQLHESGEVAIKIHNVTGELVREIRLGYKPAGQYITKDMSAYWDGKNEAGESVASGIYFYTIQAGEYSATRKMIIMQ